MLACWTGMLAIRRPTVIGSPVRQRRQQVSTSASFDQSISAVDQQPSKSSRAVSEPPDPAVEPKGPSFDELAGRQSPSVLIELFDFLKINRKWWLAPLIVALLLLSGMVLLTNSAIGPFIYVFF